MKNQTYPLFLRHPRLSSVSNDARAVGCPVGVLVRPSQRRKAFQIGWVWVAEKCTFNLQLE